MNVASATADNTSLIADFPGHTSSSTKPAIDYHKTNKQQQQKNQSLLDVKNLVTMVGQRIEVGGQL